MNGRLNRQWRGIFEACADAIIVVGKELGQEREREQGFGGLECFILPPGRDFNSEAASALVQYHRMTLRKISLANRIGIENFMLEIILRSCPGLERFQSLDFTFREEMVGTYVDPVLEVQDLQSVVPSLLYDYGEMSSPGDDTHGTGWIGPMPGRMLEPGWVCRGLKVLCIQYAEKTDEVIPGTLYSQIMRLEHLEELYLSRKILPLPATPAIIAAGADAQRRLAEEE